MNHTCNRGQLREKQTDRQKDRKTDRKTERQRQRQTDTDGGERENSNLKTLFYKDIV